MHSELHTFVNPSSIGWSQHELGPKAYLHHLEGQLSTQTTGASQKAFQAIHVSSMPHGVQQNKMAISSVPRNMCL